MSAASVLKLARSHLARHVRTNVSYSSVSASSKQSGMPFFSSLNQCGEAVRADSVTKSKRVTNPTARKLKPNFSLEPDPDQLMAMRLYCRSGRCC
mmetsp:Transcript_22392/g.27546  ORF Transcript_22392/g.27546 Transcript_22392/m.27546 type:complete len:95 (-) Transcript_22392:588-872(-)